MSKNQAELQTIGQEKFQRIVKEEIEAALSEVVLGKMVTPEIRDIIRSTVMNIILRKEEGNAEEFLKEIGIEPNEDGAYDCTKLDSENLEKLLHLLQSEDAILIVEPHHADK